jgi:gamma-glutamyltranspeptidase/glutathione hydrolase
MKGKKRSNYEAFGKEYMIASQGGSSTSAGSKMFELGGNIVDAAVAVSFAISVERPQSTGLGGGGFLLFYKPGMKEPIAFDFREKAPFKANSKMYLDKDGNEIPRMSLDGIFAVGVPGLVAGILELHKKYGKLPLEKVLEPAAELAENGFKVYPELSKALEAKASVLIRFPGSRKIFFKGEDVLKTGDHLTQKDLAKTIRSIGKKGASVFYKGWIAKAIVKESWRLGGLLSLKDFAKYNVKKRRPVSGTYKGKTIYSMTPPSSGGVHVIQILNTVENLDLNHYGVHHPYSVHMTSAAMQQSFADRARYLGDMDFVKVPLKKLISKEYAKSTVKAIPNQRALKKEEVLAGEFKSSEPDHTTHFSIMTKDGSAIVSTQTINGWFGSGVVAPGTGIVLNNEMDDFSTKVGAVNLFGAIGGQNNLVQPQKRPLSSMSPTLVFDAGKPIFALGTPSGTRILTCVAQTILNYFEYNLPLYESIAAVRYHHQWYPDEIRTDHKGLPIQTRKLLKKMGYKINRKNLGCRVQAVALERNKLHGVSDPRGEGKSLGK